MKILKLCVCISLAAIFFTACKKDEPIAPVTPQTTLEKLQHRWTFQREIYHELANGVHIRDTVIGNGGEYIEFKNNGKMYVGSGAGIMDSLTSSILGNDKVVRTYMGVFHDTVNIALLTETQLQFYNKVSYPPDFYEITQFFGR